jgi:all-trans-8'-apo-beta-carotenal 15,15'-oxygenase
VIKKQVYDRRIFLKALGGLGALSLTEHPLHHLFLYSNQNKMDRVSWKANRGTQFEGPWIPSLIEGNIPAQLNGKLFRIGPGSKKTQKTDLGHYFDGDALVTSITFNNSQAAGNSKFIQTDERKAEIAAGQMLYHDYGTSSPHRSKGFKNAPNIHFLKLGDEFLALSEASHPYAVDPENLETKGIYNFGSQLDKNMSFTAHPKVDPLTGDIYAYGITRSISPKLKIIKIDSQNGKLSELYSVSLGGFFPIHDMLLTENHIVFMVSPLKVNLAGAALGTKPISELLEYKKTDPIRILIFKKQGSGSLVEIKSQPSGLIFHNCNAYEDPSTNRLILDSIVADDHSAFELFKAWSKERMPKGPKSWITRFEIDLTANKLIQREKISDGFPTDFPCMDSRMLGQNTRYYYALEGHRAGDPLAFDHLVAWDLRTKRATRVQCDSHQLFGEPVFVPFPNSVAGEDHKAWILHLGYDSLKDQTFLDIRTSIDLELQARVWFGQFVPIGFHGSFETAPAE